MRERVDQIQFQPQRCVFSQPLLDELAGYSMQHPLYIKLNHFSFLHSQLEAFSNYTKTYHKS